MTEFQRVLLGVNIDHVATLRQARGTRYPDPVHLREDRRHIQERDVRLMAEVLQTRMNLEMAVTDAMLDFAEQIRPANICLVPERREELTTEGGLDVAGNSARVQEAVERMAAMGSEVSLFIVWLTQTVWQPSVLAPRSSNCIPGTMPTPRALNRLRPWSASGKAVSTRANSVWWSMPGMDCITTTLSLSPPSAA